MINYNYHTKTLLSFTLSITYLCIINEIIQIFIVFNTFPLTLLFRKQFLHVYYIHLDGINIINHFYYWSIVRYKFSYQCNINLVRYYLPIIYFFNYIIINLANFINKILKVSLFVVLINSKERYSTEFLLVKTQVPFLNLNTFKILRRNVHKRLSLYYYYSTMNTQEFCLRITLYSYAPLF